MKIHGNSLISASGPSLYVRVQHGIKAAHQGLGWEDLQALFNLDELTARKIVKDAHALARARKAAGIE
jgi:hypothetical protein